MSEAEDDVKTAATKVAAVLSTSSDLLN